MRALAWNCRGLGNAATVRQLKDLIRKSNPDVMILSEVKLQQEKFKLLMTKLNFGKFRYFPPKGSAGGLALCWTRDIQCNIDWADKIKIISTIYSDRPNQPWILMGIYDPPSFSGKEAFWSNLGNLITGLQLPTILMGDLNGTLKDSECLNYARGSNTARYSFDLRRMVQRTGHVDLGYCGTKFTWFKKNSVSTSGPSLKRARLDRALCSVDWRISWPNATVQHLHSACSDHNPILLDTNRGKQCMKKQFKYELMWDRDPRVFWLVKKAWQEQNHHNPMVSIHRKLKHTKERLSQWNKIHFKHLSTQVNEARS